MASFEKTLAETDIKASLVIPTRFMNNLPAVDGGHTANVTVAASGTLRTFGYYIGRDGKRRPVFRGGWHGYVRDMGMRVGDKIIFECIDGFPRYKIRAQRLLFLFGHEIWHDMLHKEESWFSFNMKYFKKKVQAREWDEVEQHLSGFTKVDDNRYSMKIFFEIRKQKYLEALDRQDKANVEILGTDLKVFSTFNEELYKEVTQLLTLNNFRENEQLSMYDDTKTAHSIMLIELKKLIEAKSSAFTPLGAHGPFPPTAAAANAGASSSVQAAVVTVSSIPVPQNQVPVLKRPRTPPAVPGMDDHENTIHELIMKRLRSAPSTEEVPCPTSGQQASLLPDLPITVAITMHQGSAITSMDFHPSHHTLLLVGSANAEITLWELGLQERLVSKPFKVWDMTACTLPFQASMVKDTPISVNRVVWSPDGNYVGVALTKHLIHLYSYSGSSDLHQLLEIDAHVGSVNDLAFAYPSKQLGAITCGDDKLIKVWDLNGQKLFTFEGHDAPVYFICPNYQDCIQFIISTAVDSKIKIWLYDNKGSRVDRDAPGLCCPTMLYCSCRSRLFSCGTNKGESYLVEWNESKGTIKRRYVGFREKSAGVGSFDTTRNRYLAAGEDSQIKFWDMDNVNLFITIDAGGGLPSLPRLRFNKEGTLLAVTTADNGFKILADADGLRSLRAIEAPSFEALRTSIDSASTKNGVDPMRRSVEKPRTLDDATEKTKPWQLDEIVDPVQCRLVTLTESTDASSKVSTSKKQSRA